MSGPEGCLVWGGDWSRGVPGLRGGWCLVLGGCLVETPRTASAAGGTHPTGMHSCLIYFYVNIVGNHSVNFFSK